MQPIRSDRIVDNSSDFHQLSVIKYIKARLPMRYDQRLVHICTPDCYFCQYSCLQFIVAFRMRSFFYVHLSRTICSVQVRAARLTLN